MLSKKISYAILISIMALPAQAGGKRQYNSKGAIVDERRQLNTNGAIINDFELPDYSRNSSGQYSETTEVQSFEFPSEASFRPERVGIISADALKPNKLDRQNERCVGDKQKLAKKQSPARQFSSEQINKAMGEGVPVVALRNAAQIFNQNQNIIKNKTHIAIADFGLNAKRKRLFIINVETGEVSKFYTSHGKNSDKDHNGCVDEGGMGNDNNSDKSSPGFMVTGGFYSGKHGRSMMLHGLEKGVNDAVCRRSVVMHSAKYVPGGRSNGCPAVQPGDKDKIFKMIGEGALYYSYPGDPGIKCVPMQKGSAKKSRSKGRSRGKSRKGRKKRK